MTITFRRLLLFAPALFLFAGALEAQRDRITTRPDRSRMAVLSGNRHPRAIPENDQGPVNPALTAAGMTLLLKQSREQQAAVQQLLARQQDPSSPDYHKWLTPEEYADRFGASQNDTAQLKAWLESEGFTVDAVARGRNWIQFSGTAEQVRNSLRTEIHRYNVNGKMHYANATEPSIPAAFSEVVSGIRGLHDFHPAPRLRKFVPENTSGGGSHRLAPDDIATIYNVAPLYNAHIDGTGQKIVVVGQTSINLKDISDFRTRYLPGSNAPPVQTILVPKRTDPGLSQDDLPEADLDIEWSGGIAQNASIIYVYTDDAFAAAQYAVDQNLAPVISMSYGFCELMDLVDLPFFQSVAQQANAQGTTWLAASGDAGATDCEDTSATVAQVGKAVDLPAAIPEVTGVGGTQFSDGGGSFWNSTNNANGGSAMSYIPEVVWNSTSASNGLAAGGGGASFFFPKPAWQIGPGVPDDGVRDVPDVSFSASNSHVPYIVVSGGTTQFFGGTSVAAPVFAGMIALLNHYLVSTGIAQQPGVGNINPTLYRLAQTTSNVFHDITMGGNMMPCAAGSPGCSNGLIGYSAGPAYDQASGLGSVNATNLVHQWSGAPPKRSAVVAAIDQNPVYQTAPDRAGNKWVFTITLNEEAGIPTTLTSVTIDGVDNSSLIASSFTSANIPANGSISATVGFKTLNVPKTVVFTFAGADNGTGTPWSTQLRTAFSGTEIKQFIGGVTNAASFQQVFAPGMIMSVFGVNMGLSAQSATAIPLPNFLAGVNAFVNGVAAPLYYVSPTQLNIQIPYETAPGTATLEVDTPYQVAHFTFQVASTAPGIFTFADGSGAVNPSRRGARGGTYTLFITGEGAVTPAVSTGRTPVGTTVPKPRQPVSMTIGGVAASIEFIGIPSWSVGVTQINFVVPSNAPLGPQQVVVTVGGVSSAPATFTVQ